MYQIPAETNKLTKLTQKGYFQPKKEYNENYHRILYIQISLGCKLQLQQTIVWNKFAIKKYFSSKTERMNIANEFFIFKLE